MKFIKNTCKIFFITVLLLSFAFSGCSDLFKGSSSSIQFKIDIPHTREISSTHYKMTVELISMDGKFSSNQERTVYPNTSEIFKFDDILIGSNIKIKAKITAEEKELYTGKTDWQEVKTGTNKISLTLEKVYQAPEAQEPEEKPPVEIKNAAKPIIVVQPISQTELVDPNSNSALSFSTSISIGAIVSDEGTLSFQWQEKTDSNWKPLEGLDVTIDVSDIGVNTSTLPIILDLNTSRVFRCIVTNTNENVNGEKTAEIISDEVTVAYIEGTLSSISATYKSDSYELLGKDFNYKNVTIEETYTNGSDNATTTIPVTADDDRYIISPNTENAIGYVPYTVTYKGTTLPSSPTVTVPVKYELPEDGLKITGTENTNEWGIDGNPELVAQFTGSATLSVGYAGDGVSNVPYYIYEAEDSEIADYDVMTYGVDIAWKEDEVALDESSSSVTVDNSTSGTKIYTATITPKTEQTWCIGENVSASYYVKVCPWEIELTDSSATSGETVDVANLTGETEYTLSASNEAGTDGTNINWESSDTENFMISDSVLITPSASTDNDQTATISAKVGDQDIASVTVTVKKEIPLGSEGNPITSWNELVKYVNPEEGLSEDSTIYISGDLEATETAYIYRPVTIIPVGKVTITRTSSNQDYIFYVNYNLTLQGSESSLITLSGLSGTENSSPLIYCVTDGVTVNLQYCTLQNANCGNNSYGSALYAGGSSIINMSDCTVQNNIGVALSLQNTGENIIENTTFTNNQAANTSINASAIYVNSANATLELNNCSFSNNNNTASSTIGELGIEKAASVTINNTTFESVTNGYNIYAYIAPSLTLKGSLSIPTLYFENSYSYSSLGIVCGEGLALKDVALPITINPAIYTGYNDSSTQVDIELFTLNNGETVPEDIFTLGDEQYVINSSTGVIEEVVTATTSNTVSTFEELQNAISSAEGTSVDEPVVIEILNDIEVTQELTINSHIKLIASETSDTTLSRTNSLSTQNLFLVSDSASLALGDENAYGNLIIDGGGAASTPIESTKSLISVSSGGTLLLSEKSILQNNSCPASYSTNGAAVYSNGGNIIIEGGTIKNNATNYDSNYGGGIYLKNGTFEMTSGVFENNSANKVGGGLYITGSTVHITGGEFKNNKLTGSETPQEGYYGSAFYLDSISSNCIISNLTFEGNSNAGYGTFYILNSTENVATISDCTFSSNNAYQRGGAIYVSSSSLSIENCTFSSNTVTSDTGNGGAVYLYNSSLNFSNCTFTDNTAFSEANTIFAEDEGSSLDIDETSVSEFPWNPN